MNTSLLKVAFVNNALYLPGDAVSDTMTADVAALLLTINRMDIVSTKTVYVTSMPSAKTT